MIIKCKNATLELENISYNQLLDCVKNSDEANFIRNMKIEDANIYYDYVLKTDFLFDYISVDDIIFRKGDDFYHVKHAGFGKFKILIDKKEEIKNER